jgi:hypothetical protein
MPTLANTIFTFVTSFRHGSLTNCSSNSTKSSKTLTLYSCPQESMVVHFYVTPANGLKKQSLLGKTRKKLKSKATY